MVLGPKPLGCITQWFSRIFYNSCNTKRWSAQDIGEKDGFVPSYVSYENTVVVAISAVSYLNNSFPNQGIGPRFAIKRVTAWVFGLWQDDGARRNGSVLDLWKFTVFLRAKRMVFPGSDSGWLSVNVLDKAHPSLWPIHFRYFVCFHITEWMQLCLRICSKP